MLRPPLSSVLFLLFVSSSYAAFAEEPIEANPVIVTAGPLGRTASELSQPVTVVTGDEAVKNPGTTLGEVLKNEPGIRSSYFGPNVSRPVIRGLNGDQINILQNGISNLDASATSADHNVAIDPLAIERIEVLRGPSALLYGSKAVGGVVNLIDNRIPSETIGAPVTGIIDGRFNSVNEERSGAVLLEGGTDEIAWHLNAFKRRTSDTRIPGFARSAQLRAAEPLEDDDEAEERNRLENSQSETQGVTVGVSKLFDRGYVGIAFSRYESEYGIVGHDHHHEEEDDDHDHEEEGGVLLDMEQNRFDFAGLYRNPFDGIRDVRYKIGFSDYEHQEFEGNEAGTVFKNRGFDSRLEFTHEKIAEYEGVFGLQFNMNDFEALGDEAFVPTTTTMNIAGFILEERSFDKLDVSFGGRLDYQEIDKDQSATFGAAQSREDFTGSASVGFVYNFPQDYKFALSTAYTQRAPNAQELFANGVHVATETFEVGDANLDVQESVGIDASFRKVKGPVTGEINLFYTYFRDFIALSPTGTEDAESETPIFTYANLPAEIYGIEARGRTGVYDDGRHDLDVELRGDYLQARNRRTGDFLPRIAPARLGGAAIYGIDNVTLRLDAEYNFAQNDNAPNELSTDDFTMLDFGVDYNLSLGETSTTFYVKATNLLDQEARNHVSFLKDRAPLPGRSIMTGLRSAF